VESPPRMDVVLAFRTRAAPDATSESTSLVSPFRPKRRILLGIVKTVDIRKVLKPQHGTGLFLYCTS
jgi:hypothetical protein